MASAGDSVAAMMAQMFEGRPLLWATIPIVVSLLVGAAVIALVKRWRQQQAAMQRLTAGDQLAHFRTLFERGELSQEEFERIRALLGQRLKQELALPAPPAAQVPGPGQEKPSEGTEGAPPPAPDGAHNP